MTHEEQLELLGLAARAAGYKVIHSFENNASLMIEASERKYEVFNPLTDDGDALRLAVALKIRIGFQPAAYAETPSRLRLFGDAAGDDVGAQTRLAIVRAAAEIGRKTL